MKLLVATDGSENALRAADYAANLLRKLIEPGSITLVTVQDDAALQRARRFVGRKTVDEYLHEMADAEIAPARDLLAAAGLPYEAVTRIGQPATEIAALGESGKFDMIVLGSKGRSPLRDLVVGSVAKQVTEVARLPILLVR
ncbi:MAG: universal stress protein [Gammaproteobacteria bacterium]